jgi:hypothetical protein
MKAFEKIDKIFDLLPLMEKCSSFQIGESGVLITSGGFEDRALAAAQTATTNTNADALVLDYKPKNERNRTKKVVETLVNNGFKVEEYNILEFNRFNPETFPKVLQKRLAEINAKNVIIDISAMSKLSILLCMNICWEMNLNTSVFYAEALEKGPNQDDYIKAKADNNLQQPSIQIFTGIYGVVRIGCLSSVAMQGQPSAAIVFMSFNEVLTQSLLNAVYPSRLFLINSYSPHWEWREEATAWIHEQLQSEWQESDNPINRKSISGVPLPKRSVSTLHYMETVRVLLELYWNLSIDHRILLAPTGSKMETVGCFIVKTLHPDIHIEYPTPEGFLDTYSRGIGDKWLIEFGVLKDKMNTLQDLERKLILGIDVSDVSGAIS